MRYARLEVLIIGIGTAAVTTSLLFTYRSQPIVEEIVAQLLMIVVLIAAVHWGRRGGFVAATLASLIYILLRIPLVIDQHGLSADVISLIIVRVAAYGLLGIIGGELCRRLKYFLARVEGSTNIDDWSQVYNQAHIGRSLESAAAQHQRYGMPYSAILVEITPGLTAELRPSRERMLVRGVASHLRNDTRLVDEIGRFDDGRFLVLLPHTPKDNAVMVAQRLRAGVSDALGARKESVTTTVLGAPEDLDALTDLREEIGSAARPHTESGS